jgi:hypothetical protein
MKSIRQKDYQKIDKTKLVITSLEDKTDDRTYWLSWSPGKRFQHIEMLRLLNYGDKAASRLQRFFEVAEHKQN